MYIVDNSTKTVIENKEEMEQTVTKKVKCVKHSFFTLPSWFILYFIEKTKDSAVSR